jgi:hypothetical protein
VVTFLSERALLHEFTGYLRGTRAGLRTLAGES